jgi:hypothetical protein
MRERAGLVPPSPWYSALHDVTTYNGLDVIASSGLTVRAQYVASWQPSVTLAVADWLEAEAALDFYESANADKALAVARAYLATVPEDAERAVSAQITEESTDAR